MTDPKPGDLYITLHNTNNRLIVIDDVCIDDVSRAYIVKFTWLSGPSAGYRDWHYLSNWSSWFTAC